MPEILTSLEMRALENAAIDSGRVTGLELMERAGCSVIDALFSSKPELATGSHRATVLCGPGNNGGDGLVIARLLLERGWPVTVFLYADPAKMPQDAHRNLNRWVELPTGCTQRLSFPTVTPQEAESFAATAFCNPPARVVVDALFGIGLNRPLRGLQPVLAACHEHRRAAYFVAVDVPSGLGERGPMDAAQRSVFPADLTVTFHRRKQAHQNGLSYCGKNMVQDIGL
ncbi:NAD(P)H-hydrate epimerase [Roseobacter denitrificans]|uniref:NAD(P)H-hydrate epimerase n=1 Tax=Roseobacter denitrificans TaxID=2434 RepID=UPI00030151D7|nr:NAD(P)H-hydrate epimerase [Roseobacter denitrificans]AVL51638.1 NAD(P)H-hydrate epimerase [Roseobacter denitrificans]SFF77692.1 NAD(P)H-hydrate epimerase [Roseobacter denitrificans OCh 114]